MNSFGSKPRGFDPLPFSLTWRLVVPFAAVAAIVILASAVVSAATSLSFLAALVRFSPILLAGVGISLMAAGVRRRVGDTRHCTACDYEISREASPAAVCPECGARWLAPGGTRVGRLKRNRLLFWTGFVVAVAILSEPFLETLLGRSLHLGLTPTALLIERVVTRPPGGATAEWDELRTRVLTADQEIDLAWGLLDKRLDRGFLSRDADAWLETTMASGRLPEPLIERYDDEP